MLGVMILRNFKKKLDLDNQAVASIAYHFDSTGFTVYK